MGKLIVMPHSAIALHDHDKGCEWYLDEDTGRTYFCSKGGAHKFVNNTDKEKAPDLRSERGSLVTQGFLLLS